MPSTARSLFLASLRYASAALGALLITGCQSVNPYYDPAKPHHTREGFKNNYIDSVDKPVSGLLKWRWQAWRQDLPPPPKEPTPVVAADLVTIKANATKGAAMSPSITWIGHATMLVQASGLNVLTDPVFSERASPFQFVGPKRMQAPGVALADLPAIDAVVISHNHYDHLDRHSIKALDERAQGKTLFLVPLGIKQWLADIGVHNAVELDWWQSHTVGNVEFHFTPVQHWTARALGDRNQSLWGGWAAFGPDFHWYFSGDTGYSQDFRDTQQHFAAKNQTGAPGAQDGFDLALIAVGAYEPRWFMKEQHVNPAEAVQIHRDLHARRSVGVHWGTFSLTDEPLDQPPRDLADARRAQGVADEDFSVMKIGETRQLPPRAATR